MKTYLALKPDNWATHLRVEVCYSLGHKEEARGYYLSVSPVERKNHGGYVMESYCAFTGVKQLILPVARRSDKKMQEANELAVKAQAELVDCVLKKNGLSLAEE